MNGTIGYLGPNGSFSESVALQLKLNPLFNHFDVVPSSTLGDLFDKIKAGLITVAVFPIRNSKGGLLQAQNGTIFLEQLAHPSLQLKWLGERFLTLQFFLMGANTCSIDKIMRIHTNEYTKVLCSEYLLRHPKWSLVAHPSSSRAAQEVSSLQTDNDAALASQEAADKYSLKILDKNIISIGHEPIMHFTFVSRNDFYYPEQSSSDYISTHVFNTINTAQITMEIEKNGLLCDSMYKISDSMLLVNFCGKISHFMLPKSLVSIWHNHLGTYIRDIKKPRSFPGDIVFFRSKY